MRSSHSPILGTLKTHSWFGWWFKEIQSKPDISNYYGNYLGYKKEENKVGKGDGREGTAKEGKKGHCILLSLF